MERKIKIFICGVGNLGKLISKYSIIKGCEIVGFYDVNIKKIDFINELLFNCARIDNIKELKKILKQSKPDVCIVTTSYLLKLDKEIYDICIGLGINVLTTCEEAFFPFISDPAFANELDSKAKLNNCTIIGTGFQDIYWGQLVSVLSASLNDLALIKGKSYYNIDECNEETNLNHGVGLEIEEYKIRIQSNDSETDFIPSFMWNVNAWICSKLELDILKSVQKRKPVIAKQDIYSKGLKKQIKIGQVIGTDTVVETITKEGIKIKASTVGMIFNKYNKAKTIWNLNGSSNVNIKLSSINAAELTASTTVNRIPDVINSQAGFITTDKLNELLYRNKNLNLYIKEGNL